MSSAETTSSTIPLAQTSGRTRKVGVARSRVYRDGKFLRLGDAKFHVKGFTYGPFSPNRDGDPLPEPADAARDLDLITNMGGNCVRVYHNPPIWFLDLAEQKGVKIFLDVAWPKNLTFVGDPEVAALAHEAVRTACRACGNHPAVFAISVVNEVPPEIVRFVGARRVEAFIDDLIATAKSEAPDCLVTFASFPTTEYLQPRDTDFVCFNVYLHDDTAFRGYLDRLQNIAGEKPLMLGEYGIDTLHEHTEDSQAAILGRHIRAVFDQGLVGTFVFSFTDDWFTHGYAIEDWAFGVVNKDRRPKPACAVIKDLFHRVPQVAHGVKFPRISVLVCSYNGASTVESCLQSMRRLRYPDFEVVFVDDGSTDGTQDILERFPEVINVRQTNHGLSYARNVAANTATGEIVVYTDSDCEADEDWLYYIALGLLRSTHVGIGGPNLIPDEGSWVADCVGLSPGGPTHVMIDDRTAEHVPGCNMAFYRWAVEQASGFDSQFRKAGDDVDFIWRLQHQGFTIGFAPAAQVWHYRRNTVAAYLKQQRGYGEAEALLKFKHPDHFNTLGASHWRGRIYGTDQIGVRFGRDVIYHGVFGTGLFQTIYRKPASMVAAMMMSIEWHLLAAFVLLLSLAFAPLVWIAAAMVAVPIVLAIIAAVQAPMPRHRHLLTRPLIAYLNWRQPIARGWARYAVRLQEKVMKREARGYTRDRRLPIDPANPRCLLYWSREQARMPLLTAIGAELSKNGWRTRIDSGWNGWDMEVYGSRHVKVRVTAATEQHHNVGFLTRVRIQPRLSTFFLVLLTGGLLMTSLLLLYLWPFSRTALLIPVTLWLMFAINRRRVVPPVFGLVDAVAERLGYYPVYPKPKPQPAADPVADDAEEEEAGALA